MQFYDYVAKRNIVSSSNPPHRGQSTWRHVITFVSNQYLKKEKCYYLLDIFQDIENQVNEKCMQHFLPFATFKITQKNYIPQLLMDL